MSLAACASSTERPGLYRDQLVFLANDGAVLALGLVRHASGTGEAKGWLGVDGHWATPVYDRFPIVARRAADLGAALRAWSSARPSSVRASWSSDASGTHLGLRTPSARMWLDAEAPVGLGTTRDPEGRVEWAVARAHLRVPGRDRDGWLVTEHTAAGAPLRPHVDYGDFTFVVAVRPDGTLAIAKRSSTRRGYDVVLWGRPPAVRTSRRVRVDVGERSITVRGGDLLAPIGASLSIRDRETSEGTAPDDRRVAYDTLLLGGEWTGVAFRIR